jgi:hypothetical protein
MLIKMRRGNDGLDLTLIMKVKQKRFSTGDCKAIILGKQKQEFQAKASKSVIRLGF